MLAMTPVIADYMFKNVSNFLYSTGRARKRRRPSSLTPYSPS